MKRHRTFLRPLHCRTDDQQLRRIHSSLSAPSSRDFSCAFAASFISPLSAHLAFPCSSSSFLRLRRPGPTFVSLPPVASLIPRRHVQSHVDELRAGNLFEHGNKVYRVESHEVHMRGRAHTTITLECRDEAGNKQSLRLRPSDKVELVQLDTEELTYLYRDESTLHLMHPTTFEPVELPIDTLPAQLRPLLADNSTVKCTKRGSDYLSIALPDKVSGVVARADGSRSGSMRGLNDMKGRVVVLDNGVEVSDCPNSVEVGDVIVVDTQTLRFMQKVQ